MEMRPAFGEAEEAWEGRGGWPRKASDPWERWSDHGGGRSCVVDSRWQGVLVGWWMVKHGGMRADCRWDWPLFRVWKQVLVMRAAKAGWERKSPPHFEDHQRLQKKKALFWGLDVKKVRPGDLSVLL